MRNLTYLCFEINNQCQMTKQHPACPRNHDIYAQMNHQDVATDDDIIAFAIHCLKQGFQGFIGFHYYNEPLLSIDRMTKIINTLKPQGAKFILWTNGLLLKDDDRILNLFDKTVISLYPETTLDIPTLQTKYSNLQTVSGKLDNRSADITPTKISHVCDRVNFELIIDFYGNLRMCCMDWVGEINVGNLKDCTPSELIEKWNIRKKSLKDHTVCQSCSDRSPGINMSKPTIALCMIVKNEASRLEKSIESVRSIIDEFVIIDTGSTDNTRDIIARYGKVHEIPFENFIETSNATLKIPTSDYILWMAADEVMQSGLERLRDYVQRDVDAISCRIEEAEGSLQYDRIRLWKNNGSWQFSGPGTHEALNGQGIVTRDTAIVVRHEHRHDSRPDKFVRDLEELKVAVMINPLDTRGWFYLARTYKDMKQYDAAIAAYDRYLKIGTWKDERWQATYDRSQCYFCKELYREAEQGYNQAIEIDPRRADPYNMIGSIRYNQKQYEVAAGFFYKAFCLTIPDDVTLFLDPRQYDVMPLDSLSLCYYYTGRYELAEYTTLLAIAYSTKQNRLTDNLKFCQDKLTRSVVDAIHP